MICPDCKAIAGEGECAECRALAEELLANSEALRALRDEELPALVVGIPPRRSFAWPWVAAAAVAGLFALALPNAWRAGVDQSHSAARRPLPHLSEPLKIKMLTPDPNVVIYWVIDPAEEKQR